MTTLPHLQKQGLPQRARAVCQVGTWHDRLATAARVSGCSRSAFVRGPQGANKCRRLACCSAKREGRPSLFAAHYRQRSRNTPSRESWSACPAAKRGRDTVAGREKHVLGSQQRRGGPLLRTTGARAHTPPTSIHSSGGMRMARCLSACRVPSVVAAKPRPSTLTCHARCHAAAAPAFR